MVSEIKEVENVWVFENQGRTDLAATLQDRELLLSELFRFSGKCCPFVEHGIDSPPEGSNAPALHAAGFGIKFPLQRLLERQQLTEVRPTQLLRQRRNNLFIWKRLSKFHHAGKIGCVKAAAKLSDQFLRQRGKNLFTISAALVL
jgi:hypothetical protein